MMAHVPDLVEGQREDEEADYDEIRCRHQGRDAQNPRRDDQPCSENDIDPFLPDMEGYQRHCLAEDEQQADQEGILRHYHVAAGKLEQPRRSAQPDTECQTEPILPLLWGSEFYCHVTSSNLQAVQERKQREFHIP